MWLDTILHTLRHNETAIHPALCPKSKNGYNTSIVYYLIHKNLGIHSKESIVHKVQTHALFYIKNCMWAHTHTHTKKNAEKWKRDRNFSIGSEHGNKRSSNDSAGGSTLQHRSRVVDSAHGNDALAEKIIGNVVSLFLPRL